MDRLGLIASRLREVGVQNICLSGGEPTDHPYFERMVSLLVRYGFSVSIITASRPEYPLDRLSAVLPLLSHITFSADSTGAALVGNTRRHFETAADLFRALPERSSKSIHLNIFRLSEIEVSTICDIVDRLGHPQLALSFLYLSADILLEQRLSKEVYFDILHRDYALLQGRFSIGQELMAAFRLLTGSENRARCQSKKLFVSASGSVRLCPYADDGQLAISMSREELRAGIHRFTKGPPGHTEACAPFCFDS